MPQGPSPYNPITGRPWGEEDGGGDAATPGAAANALATPAPIDVNTPVNPAQQAAIDAAAAATASASAYESDLASAEPAFATRALGQARDEISVGMRAEGESAMSRGADPSLFRSRALAAGKRDLHSLQGTLADVALQRRQGAIQARVGAAGSQAQAAGAAASEQRMTHLGTMAQRLAEQRALVEQAEVQSRLNEAPYTRLSNMMGAVAANRGAFAATSGGGAGVGAAHGGSLGGGSAGGLLGGRVGRRGALA